MPSIWFTCVGSHTAVTRARVKAQSEVGTCVEIRATTKHAHSGPPEQRRGRCRMKTRTGAGVEGGRRAGRMEGRMDGGLMPIADAELRIVHGGTPADGMRSGA